MKSLAHGLKKRHSARMDLRIDPEFKKSFFKYCKIHQLNSSDAARKALQQFIDLGEFKNQLFEFLHRNPYVRKEFKEFLKSLGLDQRGKDMDHAQKLINWFDELLGSEEEKLIRSTPLILLQNIDDSIVTFRGREIFEGRVSRGE
jgi:hypothetical protein